MKPRLLTAFITSLLLLLSFQNTLAQESDFNDGQNSTAPESEKVIFVNLYIEIIKNGEITILSPLGIVDVSSLEYGEECQCKFITEDFIYYANFSPLNMDGEEHGQHIRFYGGRGSSDKKRDDLTFSHFELNLHDHFDTRIVHGDGTPGDDLETFQLTVRVIEKTEFESFLSSWLFRNFDQIEDFKNMPCKTIRWKTH